jgi:hypothetical protein
MSAAQTPSDPAADVDEPFFEKIGEALESLPPRAPSLLDRARFAVRRRFETHDKSGAQALICAYLDDERLAAAGDPDFSARFIIETPEDPSGNLTALIMLTGTKTGISSGYGCSARRIGVDLYVVDTHSPFFGAIGKSQRIAK